MKIAKNRTFRPARGLRSFIDQIPRSEMGDDLVKALEEASAGKGVNYVISRHNHPELMGRVFKAMADTLEPDQLKNVIAVAH